jgi:general secretion pathway protein L
MWRTPVYLLAASLVMVLAARGLESLNLSHQQSALQEQMTSVYRQAFPGSKPMSDPWFAFKKKMEGRNSQFLPLARTLDSVLPATVRVQTLQFDAAQKELEVQISGTSAIALQAIEQRIPTAFSMRIGEENTKSGTITVYLSRKPKRQKENLPAMSHLEQMKAQLAQMQSEIGQKPTISQPVTNMADVMIRTSTLAHLPAPPVTRNDNDLEIKYATPVPFTSLANWLQTLEVQYGIVPQQVELTDKGQGNVQVERLVLSGRSRS